MIDHSIKVCLLDITRSCAPRDQIIVEHDPTICSIILMSITRGSLILPDLVERSGLDYVSISVAGESRS